MPRQRSWCSSGSCSRAPRTTPTSSRRLPRKRSAGSSSPPARQLARASAPACESPIRGCATPRSSSPLTRKRPRNRWSANLEGRVAEEDRGRERDSGARIDQALEGQSRAAGPRAPDTCSLTRHRLAPAENLAPPTDVDHHDAGHAGRKIRQQPRRSRPVQDRRRPPLVFSRSSAAGV